MTEALSQDQIAQYGRDGFILVEDVIPPEQLVELRSEIERLTAPAAHMTESDDLLDLETSHSMAAPRVRRIKVPHIQSRMIDSLIRSDAVLGPVRDLIGPNLRLHSTKLNMKSAGYGAPIDWHQDWAFYPHTNRDVLAVGVMIDDLALENGPLCVFPGSHDGKVYNHHTEEGWFCGGMRLEETRYTASDAVHLTGRAGSISIHHGQMIHGSAQNRSDRDRRMLFIEITAADAFPFMGTSALPSDLESFDARLLCGEGTITPRVEAVEVRVPWPLPPKAGSIYEIQGQRTT